MVQGKKLSSLSLGELTGWTTSFRIQDIHPSHYGHISFMKCLCSKSRGWSTKYSTFLGSPLRNAMSVKCIYRESNVRWKMQAWPEEGFFTYFLINKFSTPLD